MRSKIGRTQREARRAACSRAGTRSKAGLALGAGAFGIIGRAAAAPVTMRFGSDSPIDAAHTKSAVVFKDQVERGTDGRVQVTIFPDGQLGSNGPMTNSVKAGTLDAVVTDVTYISTAVPETDVFNLSTPTPSRCFASPAARSGRG
jgi:TRAP-type transport system periplasmic protein